MISRGHRAVPDGANGEREAEREQHVAEDGDAFEVEDVRRHPSVQMIEGSPPPRHQHGHREGGEQRGGDGDAELADKPAAAGDALRPGEPMGAVLELARERSSERAPMGRDDDEPRKRAVEAPSSAWTNDRLAERPWSDPSGTPRRRGARRTERCAGPVGMSSAARSPRIPAAIRVAKACARADAR